MNPHSNGNQIRTAANAAADAAKAKFSSETLDVLREEGLELVEVVVDVNLPHLVMKARHEGGLTVYLTERMIADIVLNGWTWCEVLEHNLAVGFRYYKV